MGVSIFTLTILSLCARSVIIIGYHPALKRHLTSGQHLIFNNNISKLPSEENA